MGEGSNNLSNSLLPRLRYTLPSPDPMKYSSSRSSSRESKLRHHTFRNAREEEFDFGGRQSLLNSSTPDIVQVHHGIYNDSKKSSLDLSRERLEEASDETESGGNGDSPRWPLSPKILLSPTASQKAIKAAGDSEEEREEEKRPDNEISGPQDHHTDSATEEIPVGKTEAEGREETEETAAARPLTRRPRLRSEVRSRLAETSLSWGSAESSSSTPNSAADTEEEGRNQFWDRSKRSRTCSVKESDV